jgi:WD40 repeat protein
MNPDGKYLFIIVILLAVLISSPACGMIQAWNITGNGEYISDIAVTADGSRLITGTMTGIVTVYDQNGTIVWKTQVPGSLVVGYQENSSAFIVGSQENTYSNKGVIRSYDRNGSNLWRVNTGFVSALGIAQKSNRVIVGNRMGDLIVLDGQGKDVAKFNDFPLTNAVADISVSDNGKVFVYALHERYPQVRYINIDKQQKGSFKGLYNGSRTGYGGGEKINAIALSSDGTYLITSNGEGDKGILCMYGSGKMIWSKDMDEITDIAILSNGSSVYAGTGKGDIFGYSRSGNLSFVYSSGSKITGLSLANDENILAAGNAKGNLYLFDHSGNLLWASRIEEFPVAEISQVEISRDGSSLVVLVNNKNLYYFAEEPETLPVTTTGIPVTESLTPEKSSLSVGWVVFGLLVVVVLARRK